jgi:hypothetical protein
VTGPWRLEENVGDFPWWPPAWFTMGSDGDMWYATISNHPHVLMVTRLSDGTMNIIKHDNSRFQIRGDFLELRCVLLSLS